MYILEYQIAKRGAASELVDEIGNRSRLTITSKQGLNMPNVECTIPTCELDELLRLQYANMGVEVEVVEVFDLLTRKDVKAALSLMNLRNKFLKLGINEL